LDIKWRNFSHALITKILVFLIVIVCFSSSVTLVSNIVGLHRGNFGVILEASYYQGNEYNSSSSDVLSTLSEVMKYQSEEAIRSGKTLTNDEITNEEDALFRDFEYTSNRFDHSLSIDENYKKFKEVYADKLVQIKDQLIKQDLDRYHSALRKLENYPGLIYYTKKGDHEFTNSANKDQAYFKTFPAYMIFDGPKREISPKEVNENSHYSWITANSYDLDSQDSMYIAFTQAYLDPRIAQWELDKLSVSKSLHQLAGYLTVLGLAFIYLLWVIGKKSPEDQEIQLNATDRIYNDFKLGLCLLLMVLGGASIVQLQQSKLYELTFPITSLIAAVGLTFLLSLVKHFKNRTLLKHTLIYSAFHKLYQFLQDVYTSGSVAVKVVVIVIGYPAIVALTFFMFPVTLGLAAWLALKKVKDFKALKEGVKLVRKGDLQHKISLSGKGELAQLAEDINRIADGLQQAVGNEIKSERLKTELITNVSHDIRTPLTSIIAYVDLLKSEKDPVKAGEYLDIIDQKSQRLKVLTEDLFEAAKASSGNIPINFETIDLVSLITQGLGELDDQITERTLEFKITRPQDKVFIRADGKLMWRAIENLFSNIFKYALVGSRVYVDLIEVETEVTLIIKNISAYELNISSEELMERFKRGDESRHSQGSGLGLSIAKSLIEIQKGSFTIEIDGDLFKVIIQMSKGL